MTMTITPMLAAMRAARAATPQPRKVGGGWGDGCLRLWLTMGGAGHAMLPLIPHCVHASQRLLAGDLPCRPRQGGSRGWRQGGGSGGGQGGAPQAGSCQGERRREEGGWQAAGKAQAQGWQQEEVRLAGCR